VIAAGAIAAKYAVRDCPSTYFAVLAGAVRLRNYYRSTMTASLAAAVEWMIELDVDL